MRGLTSSSAKLGGEPSGCCSEVSNIERYPVRCTHISIMTRLSADKSESILLGRPICLRDEDCTGMPGCCRRYYVY